MQTNPADITDINEQSPANASQLPPDFSAALQAGTQTALERIGAQARTALDADDSMFVPQRYRRESGLIGAMRDARNNGINIEAEMAHFSSSVAAHVREKIAGMGPAFLSLSLTDLDRMAHDICKALRHDDDDDDNILQQAYAPAKKAQADDGGILGNLRRDEEDDAEKAKRKKLAEDMADDARQNLHKETLRELFKDHEWKAAMKLCCDVFLHPLLHLQNHLAGESVSLSNAAPLKANRPAALHPPVPKGP